MPFSTTDIDKPYTYEDFLRGNRMKYYFLIIPVVALLAAGVYIFFVYDPNPSKDSNNGVSVTQDEPKQIIDSPEIETTTVTDAADLQIAPVTLPTMKEPSGEVSSTEEDQVEVVASDEEGSSKPPKSDEAESMGDIVSAADDITTEETTLSAVVDDPEEEATAPSAVDVSIEESTTSSTVDESIDEAIIAATAEEPVEDSSTEEATAKRVTYVEIGSVDDTPQRVSSAEDYSLKTVAQVEEKQSQSIVTDDQQQLSGGYIEHKAVITSSFSQATGDAGLSANQSARVARIFKPYLDLSRDLRKGDKLVILLDPGAEKTGNDAEQIHRLEFHGARKTLVVIRKEGSLSDYEVRSADGKMVRKKVSTTAIAVEKPRRPTPAEPESVPGKSSDTHNTDTNSGARKKPFWKKWFRSSSAEKGGN